MFEDRVKRLKGKFIHSHTQHTVCVKFFTPPLYTVFYCRQGEVKLLDYQTQQYRLFPELAKVYAFLFAGYHLRQIYGEISTQIQKGDVDQLPEVKMIEHAYHNLICCIYSASCCLFWYKSLCNLRNI